MQHSEKVFTDVEMIDAFMDILDMAIANSNEPVREEYQRSSRCAQLGYDLKKYLLDHKFIKLGDKYHQEVLNINAKKEQENG